jgi:ATP-dependent RNA helicase DDX3X
MPPSRTLIFCNSKRGVDYLDDFLYNLGMPTTSIHSDRTQREREDALLVAVVSHCPPNADFPLGVPFALGRAQF